MDGAEYARRQCVPGHIGLQAHDHKILHRPVSHQAAHQGMTLRSRTNFPVRSSGASRASHTAVSAPCATSRSAFAPPMSVLTQPGQTELTATVLRSSAARTPVTAFNAAFEMR